MTRRIKSTLLVAGFLACGLAGCGQKSPSDASQQSIKRGLSGEPSSLDPAHAVDNFSFQVVQDLYEGLTTESSSGEPLPGVASTWTVDADGRTYTFHLRTDARWSNGSRVTAKDFVAAWRRVVDPKEGSPVADNLRVIAGAATIIDGKASPDTLGVLAPSDDLLIVKLEEPAPYLPQLLTHSSAFPIYSAATARSHDASTWVSNGPYVLSSWSPGNSIGLTKNPAYWDRDSVQIAAVQYQFTSDDASQFARYRTGELDLTDSVPANAIPALRAENSTELRLAPFLATAYYGLNLAQGPTANDPKLRQALAMAVDRRRLVTSLGFGQEPAFGFVPPGIWNYTRQFVPWKDLPDSERISEAQRLYRESGVEKGSPLRLRLLYNANPVIKQTAILVAAMWKETLGVETELAEEEYRVFLQSRHDQSRWDVARLAWDADFNDASNFLDIFRSQSSNNDESFHDRQVEQLLDAAERTTDPAKRREILQTVETRVLNEYPVIPLYYFVSKRLVKPYVAGFAATPLNRSPSKTLSIRPH